MDLDISDILASVSRPQGFSSHTPTNASYADTDTATDHQLLTRAWISERCAPDLLPYPEELMRRVMSRLQSQITRIEDLASGMGDGLGAANGLGAKSSGTPNANLMLSILQTDLSRTQFLVRSFLRQRLAKLTKHAVFYLGRALDADRTAAASLSAAEVQFLRSHQALLGHLYETSFLSAFPAGLRRLDDSSGGVPMVEPPDRGKAVIVRCLVAGTWTNEREVEEYDQRGDTDDNAEGASVELRMRRGEIWVVRWRDVRHAVEQGDLELL